MNAGDEGKDVFHRAGNDEDPAGADLLTGGVSFSEKKHRFFILLTASLCICCISAVVGNIVSSQPITAISLMQYFYLCLMGPLVIFPVLASLLDWEYFYFVLLFLPLLCLLVHFLVLDWLAAKTWRISVLIGIMTTLATLSMPLWIYLVELAWYRTHFP